MKKSQKGFSLIELMIVITIVCFLVAVAIPMFTGEYEKSGIKTQCINGSEFVILEEGYGYKRSTGITQIMGNDGKPKACN